MSSNTDWKSTDYDTYVEVIPAEDSREHYAGDECWCNPVTELDNSRPLIIHQKFDPTNCFCHDVGFGEYSHQVVMRLPFDNVDMLGEAKSSDVCIDVCLASEIAELWHLGIMTTNSCCGHQKIRGTVIVAHEHEDRMRGLGYTEEVAPSGRVAFHTKTGTQVWQIEPKVES